MSISLVLLVSSASAVVTLGLCLFAVQICTRLEVMDLPDERKQHARPTPLMGGITLQIAVIPLTVGIALFVMEPPRTQHILIWATAVGAMTLVGLADDRHTLSARDRLLVSFLVFGSAAIIDPALNVRVIDFATPNFQLGLGTGWLATIFTIVCCVGLVNAVNMADGKNGLVIALSIGWLAILATRAPDDLVPIILPMIASLLVLFVYNLKGLLFLGDGGAYGVATAIGLLSISVYNSPGTEAGRAISAEELMLLFAIPVLDSFRLTFKRLLQRRSPMSPDRDHFHHILEARFGWPTGLLIYIVAGLTPALVGIYI